MEMNEIPPYHICQFLTAENEVLKSKYEKLKRKYKDIYSETLSLREKMTRFEIDKEYALLSSTTVSRRNLPPSQAKIKEIETNKIEKEVKDDPLKKLMPLYESLMKRYEIETKHNKNQAKKMRKIQADIEKLQDELFKSNQQNEILEKKLLEKETSLSQTGGKNIQKVHQEYEKKLSSIIKEKTVLSRENQKLRDELKGLDKSFFEEIEDMKYALQQSTKLNQQYERVLKHVCKQQGLNYERTLQYHHRHSTPNSLSKKKRRQSNASFDFSST